MERKEKERERALFGRCRRRKFLTTNVVELFSPLFFKLFFKLAFSLSVSLAHAASEPERLPAQQQRHHPPHEGGHLEHPRNHGLSRLHLVGVDGVGVAAHARRRISSGAEATGRRGAQGASVVEVQTSGLLGSSTHLSCPRTHRAIACLDRAGARARNKKSNQPSMTTAAGRSWTFLSHLFFFLLSQPPTKKTKAGCIFPPRGAQGEHVARRAQVR